MTHPTPSDAAFRPTSHTTLQRHFVDRQRQLPGATGDFTGLLLQIALAAKIIGSRVRRAGLADILGRAGHINVQGEEVQKLDVFAHRTMIHCVEAGGHVCLMGSEEAEHPIDVPAASPKGKYVLLFDPLDGSSNIDVGASVGTIFSIYRRATPPGGPGKLEDCLQPGRQLVAAGYAFYGASTLLVYSTGDAVHGFTLEPSIGTFLLSHPNLTVPTTGSSYAINTANYCKWSKPVQRWCDLLAGRAHDAGSSSPPLPRSHRYIGALVADFHRTLLKGGIFAYPADSSHPQGKLRLVYEAAPLAFLAEAAQGAASDGRMPILDRRPQELHERSPLFIGSRPLVEHAVKTLAGK